jgi:hypothetical protein
MIVHRIQMGVGATGHHLFTLEWNPLTPYLVELVQAGETSGEEWRHGVCRPDLIDALATEYGKAIVRSGDVEMAVAVGKDPCLVCFVTRPHRADRFIVEARRDAVEDLVNTSLMVVALDREAELATWKRQQPRWRWSAVSRGCDRRCPCARRALP